MQRTCVARGEKYEGMKGHIVVTGRAGFIGSHRTERLLADGCTSVGIDSFAVYPRINVCAAQQLLEECVGAEVSKVIRASSPSL